MEQQPKIPTLKDAQKPQVKIKGMGAGLTLFDRLKQFKKKDLAFILAGLGTLFMAPLAEHFMMAPENGNMEAGFRGAGGSGPGSNLFGTGSSPYENGGGIAQGGPSGGAGDIITPLNVRDPSALVMGPGAAQQPPAGSAAATTPPPTAPSSSNDELKDAIAHSASRAASAAVKKAPLPIPKIAVGGSGLRGLGAASGGNSSGSGSLGNIGGLGGGTAGTGGGGLNLVRSAPNFKGVAGPRGPNSPSGLDGTKKAGANAGDAFSRTGSALSGLNAAASEQIPTGGQGFGGNGQGGSGANDKPGGGAGAAGSKSVGESLAFIEAKERMMENLKLEFEKRKLKDPELLLYGIRNDSLKAMAAELTKSLTKGVLGMLPDPSSAAGGSVICDGRAEPLAAAKGKACADGKPATYCYIFSPDGGSATWYSGNSTVGQSCIVKGKDESAAPAKAGTAAANPLQGGVRNPLPETPSAVGVNSLCSQLDNQINSMSKATSDGATATQQAGRTTKDDFVAMKTKAALLIQARNSLKGGIAEGNCGGEAPAGQASVNAQHPMTTQALVDSLAALQGIVPKLTAEGKADLDKQVDQSEIEKGLKVSEDQLKLGGGKLKDLKSYTFQLKSEEEKKDKTLALLNTTLGHANTLKTELDTYLTAAEERQKVLVKAKQDIAATVAAGKTATAVLGTNDEYKKMQEAKPGVTIPDIEAAPADGKAPAAPAEKDYAAVEAAVGAAKKAILLACNNKPCEAPATPPAADAAAVQPDTNTNAAVTAVKDMRSAQRGYLGGISAKVDPKPAAGTTPGAGQTAKVN